MPTAPTPTEPQCRRCDSTDHPTAECPHPGPTPLLSRLFADLMAGR